MLSSTPTTLTSAQIRELVRRAQGIEAGDTNRQQHARRGQGGRRAVHDRPWGAPAKDADNVLTKRAIKVPKVGPKHRSRSQQPDLDDHPATQQYRPMRKPHRQIEEERRAEENTKSQAPMKRTSYNNLDAEKRKLQLQFQFKGGMALPEAGLPGKTQGLLPTNLLQGRAPRKSFRALEAETRAAYAAERRRTSELESDFEEVMTLIGKKQALLDSLPDTNAHAIAKVRAELHSLMDQSRTIDELLEADRRQQRSGVRH
ncbi:Hypothetical Protein FCC1311_067402 [Hondaea fermentalgiana]|uniref:Uncharacterized protein n=1 Tax=Hondaea fermentalgiana TaxID=2315210 RepID=A0A2R5GHZ8_9STRA|nr:Hypothetical Protein FCC1311_067402 [Hondaea fermentalgiana]|eukprot:GBG30520.1 Hypothetical Protein FCC1311_067402 [Hondaea fermentalgiana]